MTIPGTKSWGAGPVTKKAPLSAAQAKKAAVTKAQASWPAKQTKSEQEVGFFGHVQATGEGRLVTVLAGEGAPTVTDGWVKVAKVPRFQRVAYTVPEGWEPITMTVPVLFDAMVRTKERKDLEEDILNLEWLAGRTPNPTGGEVKGEPPFVEAFTVNATGSPIPLIPRQYQTVAGKSQQWYMTGIAFGEAIRDAGGARLRQKATITLLEIFSTPTALQRNRKLREEVKGKYDIVTSTSTANTIKIIAKELGVPAAWQAIRAANKIPAERVLKPGTKIKVPLTVFRQVPR
jgi:hypothetical protein